MIVIKVNGYEISDIEYLAELQTIMKKENINAVESKTIAVNNLIDSILLLNEAHRSGVEVNSDELQQEILDYMMQFKNETQYSDNINEKMISPDILHKHLQDKLTIKKYCDNLATTITQHSEEELQQFYRDNIDLFEVDETVRVSHILITEESGLEKALEIRDSIKSPEDFYLIVKNVSKCPSCLSAGDLGYIRRGKMVKEFDDVVFNLAVNEISRPVKTKFGYHILLLTDRKESFTMTFTAVKDILKKRLNQINCELKIKEKIKDLRATAVIEINEDYIAKEV